MGRFMGLLALASGAIAGGVWACGSPLQACEGAACDDAMDASGDIPLVKGVLPDSADQKRDSGKKDGEGTTDAKPDREDAGKVGHEDGGRADHETDDETEDGNTSDDATPDSATMDSSTPDSSTSNCPTLDGSTSPACALGAPPAANGCVTDSSGLFVATAAEGGSDTTGKGSIAKPYATISNALAHLGSSTAIYVCGGKYTDQITISSPITIYGGMTCTCGTWSYLPSAVPVVAGSSASFVLKVAGVATGSVDVEDMEFDGATATAGASSIAAWVNASSNVALHRVKVVGGTGGVGASGGTPTPNYVGSTAPAGMLGLSYVGDTALTPVLGGTITCGDTSYSTGGQGGVYNQYATGGVPTYVAPDPATNTGSPRSSSLVGTATSGSDGEGGGVGGIALSTTGQWSLSGSVWKPLVAGNGEAGGPGQGGGGGLWGVAQEDGGIVECNGGSGGAGGCGGAGGLGGKNGSASFALLSISSTVTLDECTITAGVGGKGGNGGNGEAGQGPGPGGPGPIPVCVAAAGGFGQGGGGGAGGAAGPSVALAYYGTEPTYGSDTKVAAAGPGGTPGTGGKGGTGDPALLLVTPSDANIAANGAMGATTVPIAVMLLPTTP